MEQKTTNQFPSEEVTLPSKGLLYPQDSILRKGVIEMKYMTAREEDILTNSNLIEKGEVIDKLLQSLILTPCDYNELLSGDKNAIMVAARILGYGSEYTFQYDGEDHTIDLTSIQDKKIHKDIKGAEKNEFNYTFPISKINITFKFLSHKDEQSLAKELKGLGKISKAILPEVSTRMKYSITSINGDYDTKTIRDFVDKQLLARDARALRNYITERIPDIDLTFNHEDAKGDIHEVAIPINVQFFWPDAEV